MRYFLTVSLLIFAQTSWAGAVQCDFDKECETGKRCRNSDFSAEFIKHEDSDTYAVVAKASVEAIGVYSDYYGQMGTLVSKNASAITPYQNIYVLSYSSAGAVLSITGLDGDDTPTAFIYTGQCEAKQ